MTDTDADFLAGTTPRLRLHQLGRGDAPLFIALYTRRETMRHIAPPLTPTAAARTFERCLASQGGARLGQRLFAIEHRSSAMPLGLCGTGRHDSGAGRLEVGVMLLPEACAQGYGREAMAVMLQRIFLATTVQEVVARHAGHAVAAARLCLRQGFRPCPQVPQDVGPLSIQTLTLARADWFRRARERAPTASHP